MSDGAVRVFPLVPRRRFSGVWFGTRRSSRRGPGDEVVGSHPYRRGDRIAWIDWKASARLSAAKASDELVVRDFLAEEAPRVALLCDRRPALGLSSHGLPWLDKRAAVVAATGLVVASTLAARAELSYLDHAEGRAYWLPPARRRRARQLERRALEAPFGAPPDALQRGLDLLVRNRALLPFGSFVFILSDFLAPVRAGTWRLLRSLGWDVVPVVIQDPVWEQSFPDVGGVVLPLADPETSRSAPTRLSRREARERTRANGARLNGLLARVRRLGFDPVLLGTSDPHEISDLFLDWSRRRKILRRGKP
jgi:uncharacterized protein (DUF58 family)